METSTDGDDSKTRKIGNNQEATYPKVCKSQVIDKILLHRIKEKEKYLQIISGEQRLGVRYLNKKFMSKQKAFAYTKNSL